MVSPKYKALLRVAETGSFTRAAPRRTQPRGGPRVRFPQPDRNPRCLHAFAARPSRETLEAAGIVASWFGALASYRGARGATFAIFPGSALRKASPDAVMAAELVDQRSPQA